MPQLPKIKYRRGFKKWTDEKVVEVRKKLGLYASSPLDALKLCEFLKIPVLTPSQVLGLPNEQLDELLTNGSSHWSAVTIPLPDSKHLIIHNPTHSPARQQSNLMHEIAHILCEHKVADDKTKIGWVAF